ncbi:MAG TPA: phosphotransferase [Deinococcales bacterium]|nr:phosphotransferase [Deinococcales bacterium]
MPEVFQPVIPAGELAGELAAWDLPGEPSVELIRRGFNDHYRVTAGDERFILRVYQNGKYYLGGPEDYRAELAVLAHLKGVGVPVAAAVPARDGSLLRPLERDGQTRYLALIEFAPGEEARKPEPEVAARLGEVVARLHLGLDSYPGGVGRHRLDERELIDLPVEILARELGGQGIDASFLAELAEVLRAAAARLPRGPGEWGLIHGDLHGGNAHVAPDGSITLFDFDHLGFGWRAYDLAPLKMGLAPESLAAFMASYESLRRMTGAERESLGLQALLRRLWDPGDWLRMFRSGIWEPRELKPESWEGIAQDLRGLLEQARAELT